MTVEQRPSRLEGIVERLATSTSAFIQAATELNANVTAALQTHSERSIGIASRFADWTR